MVGSEDVWRGTQHLDRLVRRWHRRRASASAGTGLIRYDHAMSFASERTIADHALSMYEQNAVDDAVFPLAAQRIRRAREAAGLTQDDLANQWGEQPSMYWDLELYDEEVFTVISVRQLQRLASVLNTSVNRVLFGDEPALPLPATRYVEVMARLEARVSEGHVSVEQLGDEIGWDLEPLLTDPSSLGDLPIAGLWSVCRAANVDWVAVVDTQQDA
jgi:transcriptional regulator with XRE-family HTH domain